MRKTKFLFLIFVFIFTLNLVNAIKYYDSDELYSIEEIEVKKSGEEYYVELEIESEIEDEDLKLSAEIIYEDENLVAGEKTFNCKRKTCKVQIPIKKVFFDNYRLNLYSKWKNKYYVDKHNFKLKYIEELNTDIEIKLHKNEFEIGDEFIYIPGTVINEDYYFSRVIYFFEVYPLSKPDQRQYFEKICYGSCGFDFKLDPPYIIDDYQINVYSVIGEDYTNFKLVMPGDNNENNQTNETEYFLENIPENILYSNDNNVNYSVGLMIKDQYKNITEIKNTDYVDIVYNISQGNVDEVVLKSTRVDESSLGFEYVDIDKITLEKNQKIVNAFAINPKMSNTSTEYTVDFIAQGNSVYKCTDYDFVNQDCFGSYKKILDTIQGKKYTLSLDPKDPIFAEVIEPDLNVQSNIVTGSSNVINQGINVVSQNQSIILFRAINNEVAPDSWQFTPDFIDDSTISFTRYTGTTSTEIASQVISSNLFDVQRGEISLEYSVADINIPINEVNLSQSFVVVYGRCDSGQNADNHAGFFTAKLTLSNNLYIKRGQDYKCRAVVNWQVVDFDGASVQTGNVSFDDVATSVTDSINGINQLKSFLIFSSLSIGGDPGMNSNLIRGEISNYNEVVFTRTASDGYSQREVEYYVIEHPDLSVQRGLNSFSNDVTQSILPVNNLSKSFITSSIANSGGGQTYRNFFYYANLIDESTLNFNKQTTSQTNDVNWEIIEFVPPTIDLSGQVDIESSSGNDYSQDDLICKFDLGSDVDNVLVNWYKNSQNVLDLYLPFEGGSSFYLNDYSDNKLVSLCTNCPSWNSNLGLDGYGTFLFDGNNDYIEITDNNLDLSSTDFSISLWINSQVSDNNYHGFFGYDPGTTAQRYPGMWVVNQNQIHFGFGDGSTWCSTTSGSVLSGGWNHLVLTYDGTDLNLFVNGVRQVNFNGCAGTSPYAQTTLNIGRVDNYFNGYIDDVRLYKSVLSNGEIINLFSKNVTSLSNEETDVSQIWSCRVNGYNDVSVGPDYLSDNLLVLDNPLPPVNSTPNTCSGVFGFYCGMWPSTSEGDNTFDTCSNSAGSDENVEEVYINTTSAYGGDSVTITCQFDPYSAQNEEYIYYYDGSIWTQVYSGSPVDGNVHNVSVSVELGSYLGEHWFRCIEDWDGEGDECADVGSYYDNDDVKVDVIQKPVLFDLNILNPKNQVYTTNYITSFFETTKFADISYSIDNSPYVEACSYCKNYTFSDIYRNGVHNITVKAIEFGTANEVIKSVGFEVNFTNTIPPLNTNKTTCSDAFGFYCGTWPSTNEGDNTFDSCSNSAGSDENVQEVYLNTSSVYFGGSVEVTCTFDPYSNQNEEYIYYYNGNSWRQIYSGNSPSGDIYNLTRIVTIDNIEGTHWFRCIIDWDGEGDECADVGSYYDNDDVNLTVIDNSIPEIPLMLSISSPLNTTYMSADVLFDFFTTINANISYSINGDSFVSVCDNCTSFISNMTLSDRYNFLEVRAINFENASNIVFENITFSLDSSVDLEPDINNLNLISSSGQNLTDDNLICSYSENSLTDSSVVNWFKNVGSLTYVNLPMESGIINAIEDYSSNNNDVVISGDVGYLNGSLVFDGNDDYLNFGDLDEMDSPNAFSFAIWFKRSVNVVTDSTNHNIDNVLLAQSSQNNNDNLEIGTDGTNIELYIDTGGTDNFVFDAGIVDNRWYHLVVTYDSSRTDELELYLDGNLIQSWNTPNGDLASSSNAQLTVGGARPDRSTPWGDFNGEIDNLQIYEYAIDQDMITNLYNNQSNILPPSQTSIGDIFRCDVTAFSSDDKSVSYSSNNLQIIEGSYRGIYLQLIKNITRIKDGKFNVDLRLNNLEIKPTPKNQVVKMYGFVKNSSIVDSRKMGSSSWFNIIENSINIDDGVLYEWSIVENNLDDSALNRNLGVLNSTNSANINFNISLINSSFSDLIKIGFDPVFE